MHELKWNLNSDSWHVGPKDIHALTLHKRCSDSKHLTPGLLGFLVQLHIFIFIFSYQPSGNFQLPCIWSIWKFSGIICTKWSLSQIPIITRASSFLLSVDVILKASTKNYSLLPELFWQSVRHWLPTQIWFPKNKKWVL